MKEENSKTFKIFLMFIGALIGFTLIGVFTFKIVTKTTDPPTLMMEFFTVVIILISVVYLGKEKVLTNETVAAIISAVAGFVLGKNV